MSEILIRNDAKTSSSPLCRWIRAFMQCILLGVNTTSPKSEESAEQGFVSMSTYFNRILRTGLPRSTPLLLLITLICVLFKHCNSRCLSMVRRNKLGTNTRFIFSTPRCGGFNNQLISIYNAIYCAQTHNFTLVLPLIYENVRFDTNMLGEGPYPFEDYFNVSALRRVVRCVTPAELDEIGLPCDKIYVFKSSTPFLRWREWLQSRNEVLKIRSLYRKQRLISEHYAKRFKIGVRNSRHFTSSNIDVKCVDDTVCTNFTGMGPYSKYELSGQGYDIRTSSRFRSIRSAFQPSFPVTDIAQQARLQLPARYNAIHVRRGDYTYKCAALRKQCERFGRQAFYQSASTIIKRVRQLPSPTLPLFVSSTHHHEVSEMLTNHSPKLIFMEDIRLPNDVQWLRKRIDIMSLVSQIIASEAEEFVGNRFSSYSAEINNLRYLRKNNSRLRFF